MQQIIITDLKHKPHIDFFNIDILDKVFTGIKKYPNVYVFKTDSDLSKIKDIEFIWQGFKYQLFDCYEHYTTSEWKIVECRRWQESIIDN